jgi:hypothetical protein
MGNYSTKQNKQNKQNNNNIVVDSLQENNNNHPVDTVQQDVLMVRSSGIVKQLLSSYHIKKFNGILYDVQGTTETVLQQFLIDQVKQDLKKEGIDVQFEANLCPLHNCVYASPHHCHVKYFLHSTE